MIKYFLGLLTCFPMLFSSLHAQNHWSKVKDELIFSNPPFLQCHASTIIEVSNGKILIACFGGSAEAQRDVNIWYCTLNGKTISTPKSIANGVINDSLRSPTWNPVFFKSQQGKLFLFYKVGPNPREWWGMVKYSMDEGQSWSTAKRLPPGIIGPVKNKPIQLANGTILSPSSVEESTERWKVHIEKSVDEGENWTRVAVDSNSRFDVIQPSILTYPGNRLQLLCRSKQGSIIQSWSADGGNSWAALTATTLLNPNSGTDAVTLKDGTQLIVYNPDLPGKDWFNGRGKLRVASSSDGKVWTDVAVLEDGDKEEYSYPAIIQTTDGLVHITYTYNRKNIKHVVLSWH